MGTCAFLAGTFLTADARRAGREEFAGALCRRTLAVGMATGLVVFAALLPLRTDAPTLFEGLSGRGLPLMVVSAVAGSGTLLLLATGRYALARFTAVGAVGSVVLGWGSPSTRVCWSTRSPSPMVPVLPPPCRASWSP